MSALEAENKRLPKPRQRELDASSRSRDGVILTSGVCVFSHIVSASRRGAGVGWFRGAGLGAQVSVPVRHPRAACRPCGQVYDGMAPRLYVLQKHAEQVQLTAIPRRGFNTHTFFRDGSFWGAVPQPLSDAPRSAIPCGRAACHTRDTLAVLQGCGFRPSLGARTPALRPGRHPSVPVAMSSMWFL